MRRALGATVVTTLAWVLQGPSAATARPPYKLGVAGGWQTVELPDAKPDTKQEIATEATRMYKHPGSGRVLVVTKTSFPNHGARDRIKAYVDAMESGLRKQPGYKRLHRAQQRVGRVPVVDLVFRRKRGTATEVVMMRFLLFRSSSYAVTLTTPAPRWRRWKRSNQRLVNSFRPTRRHR